MEHAWVELQIPAVLTNSLLFVKWEVEDECILGKVHSCTEGQHET